MCLAARENAAAVCFKQDHIRIDVVDELRHDGSASKFISTGRGPKLNQREAIPQMRKIGQMVHNGQTCQASHTRMLPP